MTNRPGNLRIAFAGSGSFGEKSLEVLAEKFSNITLITKSDLPSGRGMKIATSSIKRVAKQHNIPTVSVGNKNEFWEVLKKINPDLGIISSFGIIITPETLEIPKNGVLNIHPSLLPKHRGTSPISTVILNNEEETGLTIIQMNEAVDSGPIVFQKRTKLSGAETYTQIEDKLIDILRGNILGVVEDYQDESIEPHQQDNSIATYTAKLSKEDGCIRWAKETAPEIDRKIRALNPWPGTFTLWNGKNLKILDARICKAKEVNITPGTVKNIDNEIVVGTLTGNILLDTIQLTGKKPTKAKDFIHGYPNFVGSKLG